jgi:hypothetical protein
LLRWGLKNKLPGYTPVCDRSRSEVRNSSHVILSAAYDACGSKRVGEFYGTSTANCRRADLFFPKAGFMQILSSGKSGTPPCKSGQLEKDLGLEASSLRHAARLIIFEIMRSFFLGSKEQASSFLLFVFSVTLCLVGLRLISSQPSRLTLGQTRGPFRTLTVSVRALRHFNLRSF